MSYRASHEIAGKNYFAAMIIFAAFSRLYEQRQYEHSETNGIIARDRI